MYSKLKRDEVTIKGRGCAYRRKRWKWISKEYMPSPTVSTKGIMILCMIDAMERPEVQTANIIGDFLHSDYVKGDIHIKLEGAMVTLLEDINLEHYIYFIQKYKLGGKCMYAESKKGIYGTLYASLLFLGEKSKNLRRNDLSEKLIRLVRHEQDHS